MMDKCQQKNTQKQYCKQMQKKTTLATMSPSPNPPHFRPKLGVINLSSEHLSADDGDYRRSARR